MFFSVSPPLCQITFDFETNFLHVKTFQERFPLFIDYEYSLSFQTYALSSAFDWLDSPTPKYDWLGRHLSSISLKTCLNGSTSSGNCKNHKKDTAEIHLMFTANEEIKEGKFSRIEHFDSRRFF